MPTFEELMLGIVFSLGSACIFSLAAILQKREVGKLPELKFDQGIKHLIDTLMEFVKNKKWIFAVLLGLLGAPLYLVSFNLIGITLAQPLQGFGVLVLVIFAVRVLKETLSKYEKIGIILLLFAPLFLGLGGIKEELLDIFNFGPLFSGELLYTLFIFTVIVFITSVILYIIHFKISKHQEIVLSILSGIDFAVGAIYIQILVPILEKIFINGLGGLSNNLILFLIAGFVVIAGNILGIIFLQSAFQKGKAITVVPFQSSCVTILPVLAGLIIFSQKVLEPIFFVIGIAFILIGVISLSRMQEEMEIAE